MTDMRLGMLCLRLAALALAAPATAAPLGLAPGDLIEQIEWANDNGGGAYDSGTQSAAVDGDIQSVTINPSITNLLSGVTFTLDLDLQSHQALPLGGNLFAAQANFVGSASVTPDFTISDNTGIILQGNLTTVFNLAGIVNVLENPTFLGAANIVITGGDPNLVNALGGMGGTGEIQLSGGLFNFSPNLITLLGDLNAFNDNFTFSGSGIIVPDSSSPFVPEPSTALLVAGGLLGMIGVSRRARSRG